MSVNALVLEGLRTSCKQNVSGGWVQKSYELAGLRTTHHAKDTANTRLSCRNAAKRRFWGHTMGGGSEPRAGIIYIYIEHIYFSNNIYPNILICIYKKNYVHT